MRVNSFASQNGEPVLRYRSLNIEPMKGTVMHNEQVTVELLTSNGFTTHQIPKSAVVDRVYTIVETFKYPDKASMDADFDRVWSYMESLPPFTDEGTIGFSNDETKHEFYISRGRVV